MQEIILTVGLPASGKTTWTCDMLKKHPERYKRINKDSLRAMMDDGQWSRDNEKHVLQCRDELIELSILNGFDVIVDDTNLDPKHKKRIEELALEMASTYKGADGKPMEIKITIQDFTHVPLDVCLKRDAKRQTYVGEKVIKDMYKKYLAPEPEIYKYDPKLGDAILIDIDGTIAHRTDRGIYDWKKVGSDRKDNVIHEIVSRFQEYDVILMSGRNSVCREETEKWLEENKIFYNELFMRAEGDMRKDFIVKKELYDANIKGKYNILFALDDRNQVVDLWRSLGIKTLQVEDGDF